ERDGRRASDPLPTRPRLRPATACLCAARRGRGRRVSGRGPDRTDEPGGHEPARHALPRVQQPASLLRGRAGLGIAASGIDRLRRADGYTRALVTGSARPDLRRFVPVLIGLLLLAAMGVFVALRLSVSTDITHFLAAGDDARLA